MDDCINNPEKHVSFSHVKQVKIYEWQAPVGGFQTSKELYKCIRNRKRNKY